MAFSKKRSSKNNYYSATKWWGLLYSTSIIYRIWEDFAPKIQLFIWVFYLILEIPWDQKLVNFCLDNLYEGKCVFFSISTFWQVNYIFHKLLGNTKHVKFQLCMNQWWSFVQNGSWVHFSCVFWGIPTWSHVDETVKGLKGRVLKKKFFLPIESWFFTFFSLFFCSWFYMMSSSMWSLRSKCKVFNPFI